MCCSGDLLPAPTVYVFIYSSRQNKTTLRCPESQNGRHALLEGGLRHSPCCCLFSEPSGMPAGVWARSVSASEIEVTWQALAYSSERVLGYEVHFNISNGNRNHTRTRCKSSACHCLCGSAQPPLTAKPHASLCGLDRKSRQSASVRRAATGTKANRR